MWLEHDKVELVIPLRGNKIVLLCGYTTKTFDPEISKAALNERHLSKNSR